LLLLLLLLLMMMIECHGCAGLGHVIRLRTVKVLDVTAKTPFSA